MAAPNLVAEVNAFRCLAFGALIALQSLPLAASTREATTFEPPPILMYHRIDVASPSDEISRDLTVTPAQLLQQLAYLKRRHVVAISMAQLEARMKHRKSLDDTVVLTFDDGYGDQYKYAVPILRRFGDSATFYIVTGNLGRARHLTWAEIRTMARDGMDIAAHGVRHDDLSTMSATEQRGQIVESIDVLQTTLHARIESYAYPSGRFNRDTLDIVRRAGVPLAVTTDPVNIIPPESALQLPRLRVHGWWKLHDFAKAIEGARASRHPVLR